MARLWIAALTHHYAGAAFDEDLYRVMPCRVSRDTREAALQRDAVTAAVRERHVRDQVAVDGCVEGRKEAVARDFQVHDVPNALSPRKYLTPGGLRSIGTYIEVAVQQAFGFGARELGSVAR
ncbi:hypothetical protein [Cupriavidus necator]|uniref:hypothetical protein n=1 Tax=Cupriavidus necator TaxID=106590 RepID=UPI001E3B0E79|nr:hypothetical protein [Cupriavidus necator]